MIFVITLLVFPIFTTPTLLAKDERINKQILVAPKNLVTQKFKVTGMTCGSCSTAVKIGLKKIRGVVNVKFFYKEGLTIVEYDKLLISPKEIKEVIQKLGYGAEII